MDRVRNGEPVESAQQPDFHFTPTVDNMSSAQAQVASANGLDEKTLSQQLRSKRQAGDLAHNHLHTVPAAPHLSSYGQPQLPTVPPASDDNSAQAATNDSGTQDSAQAQAQMTNTPDPAILNLAQNNDLNIETIARQAKKDDSKDNEVVISLR
jgi:hypothetical protein